MKEPWELTPAELAAFKEKPRAREPPGLKALREELEADYSAAKERDMADKIGAGQLKLRGLQGLAELGKAFGQALPDSIQQDVPGVVMPTPQEVSEMKAPEPESPKVEYPEPEM